jgi:hypothetical protein
VSTFFFSGDRLAKIAIFTTPKPFVDPHTATIQTNALNSWVALGSEVEVWLVGEEEGVADAARKTGASFIPDVDRTPAGTPRIDSIFNQVRQASSAEILCYVNADILLFTSLLDTIRSVQEHSKRFLLVGQRWDMNINQSLEIHPNWEGNFLPLVKTEGKLHPPAGSDYFIFPRELYTNIPPFAVGRVGWDNWMIFQGRREGIDVIDATQTLTIVHQNHDFKHLPGGRKHRRQPESLDNISLAGGRPAMFTLADVNKKLSAGNLKSPDFSLKRLYREITILPLLKINSYPLAKKVYTLLNPLKTQQDRKKEARMKEHVAQTLKESK